MTTRGMLRNSWKPMVRQICFRMAIYELVHSHRLFDEIYHHWYALLRGSHCTYFYRFRGGRHREILPSPSLYSEFMLVEPSAEDQVLIYHPVKDYSQHTIGVEFSSRTVKLGEKRIKLQVSQNVMSPSVFSNRHFSYGIPQARSDFGGS
jgi:hypothetical protein